MGAIQSPEGAEVVQELEVMDVLALHQCGIEASAQRQDQGHLRREACCVK